MPDFDENAWSPMQQAAYRGFHKSIHRFVEEDSSVLESETPDQLKATPFLLSVLSGSKETVVILLNLGSKIDAIDNQNHGAVEICALNGHYNLLLYFIELNNEKLSVWKRLLNFLVSDDENEALASGKALQNLTDSSMVGYTEFRQQLVNNGAIPTMIKFVVSSISDESKLPSLMCMFNLLESSHVQDLFMNTGGPAAFVKLLKSAKEEVVKLSAMILERITQEKDYAETVVKFTALPAMHKIIQSVQTNDVLIPVLKIFANIAKSGLGNQKTIGTLPSFFEHFVQLVQNNNDVQLMISFTEAADNIVRDERNNQNAFVAANGSDLLLDILVRHARSKEVLLNTVDAIHSLAENNPAVQEKITSNGIQKQLMNMLKKRGAEDLLEKSGMALWALAGDDIDKKRKIAEGIGVSSLIEFLNSKRENLHFISSEALGVLAQGPVSLRGEIANSNGIQPLIRILSSDKDYEHIVLSVIRTLRYLCVGTGNVPHINNQNTIDQSGGVDTLIHLMVDGTDERVQVEAALTLAHVTLGRETIMNKINSNNGFSYIRILKMVYAEEEMVRLLAGSALATFAYNSVSQQKEIAAQGGVRFNCFVPFLKSTNEFYRCNAAYQIVILSLIIPDEEQATSSAIGIKILVELIQESKSTEILALAADCIACLAHTRAGVPAAIIAINGIDHLFDRLNSGVVRVEGSASIALSYLSYNHTGERRLLYKCRTDPYLKKILNKYTKDQHRLSESFIEGWRHFKRVGVPPIPDDRIKKIEISDDVQVRLVSTPKETTNDEETNSYQNGDTPRSSRMETNLDTSTIYESGTEVSFQDPIGSVPATRTHSSVSINITQPEIVLQEG